LTNLFGGSYWAKTDTEVIELIDVSMTALKIRVNKSGRFNYYRGCRVRLTNMLTVSFPWRTKIRYGGTAAKGELRDPGLVHRTVSVDGKWNVCGVVVPCRIVMKVDIEGI